MASIISTESKTELPTFVSRDGKSLIDEQLIGLNEAAKRLPSGKPGKAVHISTIHRWRSRGLLQTVRIGGRWFTSIEAIHRFLANCNSASRSEMQLTPKTLEATTAAKKAMEQLSARGI